MAHHVLIVSPIPSHPQDQGNSARIYAMGRLLQGAGYVVHFLYYQMEGLTPAQLADMQGCWDFVHPVPCIPRNMAATGPGYYRLDDWADPAASEAAAVLHRRFRFRAVVANYVWFSAVLEVFGRDVVKILDTHDVFGGRDKRFRDAGLEPEWFYTTPAEESRGLGRADIVLAIQDEEAAYFRSTGHENVRVIGHMLGHRPRVAASGSGGAVRVGYFASGNPLNRSSFEALLMGLHGRTMRSDLDLLVAGSLCDSLPHSIGPFRALGRVDQVDDFYDSVDVVINPMQVGTGLKIKSVEAVFEGLPLLATTAAMTGLPADHRLHTLHGVNQVADCLVDEVFDTELLTELMAASVACAQTYSNQVRESFLQLMSTIDEVGPRLR